MTCGCSLCLVRAGGPSPKLDGCRCPDQMHVSPNCFVTSKPSKEDRAIHQDRYVLGELLGPELLARWKAGEMIGAEVISEAMLRIQKLELKKFNEL